MSPLPTPIHSHTMPLRSPWPWRGAQAVAQSPMPAHLREQAPLQGQPWAATPYRGSHRPEAADSANDLRAGAAQVIKGGSFLCAVNYCSRYRSTPRHGHENDLPTSHIGFRTLLRSS